MGNPFQNEKAAENVSSQTAKAAKRRKSIIKRFENCTGRSTMV
jgi:hypothetical protein